MKSRSKCFSISSKSEVNLYCDDCAGLSYLQLSATQRYFVAEETTNKSSKNREITENK